MPYTDTSAAASPPADNAVEVRGLTKSYGTTTVLNGVDLTIAAGTAFALLGPNGAGKTTLVRILATLLRPDAGTAVIAGHNLAADPVGVKSAISLTGQHAAVDELLTGLENLVMMGRLRRLGRRAAARRAAALLDQFDLGAAADRPVKTYSGGTRRKLDLAISLIVRPQVIFLDEPTTGLDPRSRESLWLAVRALVDDGVTVLLTTQYLEEADRLADRIALLDDGRIVAEGTADVLKASIAGEVATLEFTDDATFARALDALASRPDSAVGTDPPRRTIQVPTDGTVAGLRALLNDMHRDALEIQRISLHRPTLDDVFLSMTAKESTP